MPYAPKRPAFDPSNPPSVAELAYVAGFFDGEGCITISTKKNTNYFRLTVQISQTDLSVLEWIASRFGGSVHNHGKQKERCKKTWIWFIGSFQAHEFLRVIRPYLIVKAERADIAMMFRETMCEQGSAPKNRSTPEIIARRWELKRKISELNKRGVLLEEAV